MLNRVSGVVRAIVHPRSKGPDHRSDGQARTTTSRSPPSRRPVPLDQVTDDPNPFATPRPALVEMREACELPDEDGSGGRRDFVAHAT